MKSKKNFFWQPGSVYVYNFCPRCDELFFILKQLHINNDLHLQVPRTEADLCLGDVCLVVLGEVGVVELLAVVPDIPIG